MAIAGLRIAGFKRFADSGEIPLRPLTVLVGKNSSGKSSVGQALLLLKQTLEARGFANTLNLKGPLFTATSYREIVHNHEVARPVSLTLTVDIDDPKDLAPAEGTTPWLFFHSMLEKVGRFSATIVLTIESQEPFGPQLREIAVEPHGQPLAMAVYEVRENRPDEGRWRLKMPSSRNWRVLSGFGPLGNSLFPAFLAESKDLGHDGGIYTFTEDVTTYNLALAFLDRFLREMKYLGPFRTPPKPRYEFAGKDFPDIGVTGDHTIDALIADQLRKSSKRSMEKIGEWLHHAGLAEGFSLVPVHGETGAYQAEVTIGSTVSNYAQVGFGVSQVLPVLVQALRTTRMATFVCEQPELHLHPDAQVALADFFIDRVREKRHVLLETHSEPLLLGIRRALAEEALRPDTRMTREDVSFLYVDDSRAGEAVVRRLELDETMNFTHWPPGFMDATTQERLRILDKSLALSERASGGP